MIRLILLFKILSYKKRNNNKYVSNIVLLEEYDFRDEK